MSIANKIEQKKIGYWDFADTKSVGVHKISAYPATMVPDMQKELIAMIIKQDSHINNILDPFHGSGVTLVEGANLGLLPIGIDINPLANLITKVKLQGVSKSKIYSANKNIEENIFDSMFTFEVHTFPNINKWFREDFIETFSKIRTAIVQEKCANIRRYYWVCLINVLKKYSNTRSSTFKLHVKESSDIISMENNINQDFIKNINHNVEFLPNFRKDRKINLKIGDSKKIVEKIPNNSIDIICTSPPYGDNSTTVTYGQYSSLPLFWIDNKDLSRFDAKLLENYSSIDSLSLGGTKSIHEFDFESQILNDYLNTIIEKKQKKVKFFVYDYLTVMQELARVVKPGKYIVLTLGNRRVDDKVVPLTEITKEYFCSLGMNLEVELKRNIPNKRMPSRVSKVNNKSVKSMSTEYVLIFKK